MTRNGFLPGSGLGRPARASLSAGILLFAIAAAASPAAAFLVTGVQAYAEPASYTGACPTTITFVGEITVDGPGTVSYRWEHSPGTGLSENVQFGAAGTKTVTLEVSWSGSDYLTLVIDSPNQVVGSLVGVAIHCILPGNQKTDLALTNFVLRSVGVCEAGKAAFTLSVTVKNIGMVAYPYMGQHARVIARDTLVPSWLAVGSLPAISAGGSENVDIPVPYPDDSIDISIPRFFQAQVDDLNNVDESNENNNFAANKVTVNFKTLCPSIAPQFKEKVKVKKFVPSRKPQPPDPGPLRQQVR